MLLYRSFQPGHGIHLVFIGHPRFLPAKRRIVILGRICIGLREKFFKDCTPLIPVRIYP